MTQMGEGVMIGMVEAIFASDKIACDHKPDSSKWVARIIKWGEETDCDPKRLYRKMQVAAKKGGSGFPFLGGKAPFVAKGGPGVTLDSWRLSQCKPEQFPLQAHHLIPKSHLPTHGVCAFLAKKYKQNKDFDLQKDAPYSTDFANNGYCLPYATAVREWKSAGSNDKKKSDVANKLMEITKRQLHQGSHKSEQYQQEGEQAEEEEDDLHDEVPGYLSKLDDLLDNIHVAAEDHLEICRICCPSKAQGKKKIFPREAIARHMDQVSGIMKALMDSHIIFVSERAFLHFEAMSSGLVDAPEWLDSADL
jgi:hypothetical protein